MIRIFIILALFSATVDWAQADAAKTPAYIPIDSDLWSSALALEAKKDWDGLLGLCRANAKSQKNLQGAEARLVCIKALIGAGFPLAASEIGLDLLDRYPGSQPTLHALIALESAFHHSHVDSARWTVAVQTASLPDATPEVRSMIQYFQLSRLLPAKRDRWAKAALEQIAPDTYWGARIKFYDAILDYEAGQKDQAVEALQNVLRIPQLPVWFENTVKLQLARAYYGEKEVDKAEKLYKAYSSDSRDYGRALLDRAWIEYHRQDYGRALGLLVVLKSPFFATTKDPERYLLAVTIYRKLCHFREIKSTVKDFNDEYRKSISAMEKQDFFHDEIILGLTLAYGRIQEEGDLVAQMRNERINWSKKDNGSSHFDQYISGIYNHQEQKVRERLEFDSRELMKGQAEKILKVRDQLQLADYLADLEKLRPENPFAHQQYKDAQEATGDTTKLFWTHSKEFWWDELNDYRVLIDDRCVKPSTAAGDDK